MQTPTLSHAPTLNVPRVRFGAGFRRWLLSLAIAAALLIGGYQAYRALESDGAIIRRDLARAGRDVASFSWSTPKERVAQAISHHFPTYRVTVDGSGFPAYVTVTLHDLSRADCRAANRMADRIEGDVVIAMERSSGPACQERTSITWRIMP